MFRFVLLSILAAAVELSAAAAGQAPFASSAPNLPIGSGDRVYAAEQFSNTVSVVDPARNILLGVIRLGDPQPANFSPLYRGQVLVHGMGFSPDRKTLAVVSIGSNSVTFIDTATNAVKHTTYVGRSPHEAFFTPDGREVWVTVRGENYVSVIDAGSFQEVRRIVTPAGPGMTIFPRTGSTPMSAHPSIPSSMSSMCIATTSWPANHNQVHFVPTSLPLRTAGRSGTR